MRATLDPLIKAHLLSVAVNLQARSNLTCIGSCIEAQSPLKATASRYATGSAAGYSQGEPTRKDRSRQLAALQRYGRDLTAEARRGLLDPVIGRKDVIQRTLQVLLRRTKHNPILIGEAGVGKTAIVEGIAQLMAAPQPLRGLGGKKLVALDVASIVAGSTYRGEFEERVKSLLQDCETAAGSVVLFIDEIHIMVGTGNVEGGLDFANMLKPALARSQLQVIGATTLDEYRQHIETDPALSRRFQPVLVEEPSAEECLELLTGLAPKYEAFHQVSITQQALATAVAAAQRYVAERRLPDAAIDLLDEAAAKVRLGTHSMHVTQHNNVGAGSSADNRNGRGRGRATTSCPASSSGKKDSSGSSSSRWIEDPAGGAFGSATAGRTLDLYRNSTPAAAAAVGVHLPADQQQQLEQPSAILLAELAAQGIEVEGATPPTAQQRWPSHTEAGRGAAAAVAQTWSDWVTARGWHGHSEVHKQQLLEWFGASPAQPLKGFHGHRQTTAERKKKHAQFFGPAAAGSRPHPALEATAVDKHTSTLASCTLAGSAGAYAPVSVSAPLPQQQGQHLSTANHQACSGGSNELHWHPRSCPHCGTLVTAPSEVLRLTCHDCGFRFLNLAPEKLQLGTTVLLGNQQQHALGLLHPEQPKQQMPPTQQQRVSRPQDQIDTAGLLSMTALATQSCMPKRTVVAVKDGVEQAVSSVASETTGTAAAGSEKAELGWQRGSMRLPTAAATDGPTGNTGSSSPQVTGQHILEVVSESTGIPVNLVSSSLTAAVGCHTEGPTPATWATQQVTVHELARIHAALTSAVQGQDAAAAGIIGALRLSRLGLQHSSSGSNVAQQRQHGRPVLSLLLNGPSGVGKSSMARVLAECLMPGEPQGVVFMSCGELSERHSISRLVGAPPGYVGYGKGGLLTEAIRRHPHCVVVLDDLERAHPDVVGLLLQAIEDGRLSDSLGHHINLRSATLILTANTADPAVVKRSGAAFIPKHEAVAVAGPPGDKQHLQSTLSAGLKQTARSDGSSGMRDGVRSFSWGCEGADFGGDSADSCGKHAASFAPQNSNSRPATWMAQTQGDNSSKAAGVPSSRGSIVAEVASRVDEVVEFQPLESRAITSIVRQQLQQAMNVARQQGVELQVEESAATWLASVGSSPTSGARQISQLIRRHLMVPLATAIMDAYTSPHDGDASQLTSGVELGCTSKAQSSLLSRSSATCSTLGGDAAADGAGLHAIGPGSWALAVVRLAATSTEQQRQQQQQQQQQSKQAAAGLAACEQSLQLEFVILQTPPLPGATM